MIYNLAENVTRQLSMFCGRKEVENGNGSKKLMIIYNH